MTFSQYISWVVKPIVFFLCLLPAISLAIGFVDGRLGMQSLDLVTQTTGEWAIRLLLITLLLTPLRELFNWMWLAKFRRMMGLFAFFYANLHLITYVTLGHRNTFDLVLHDLGDRPFVALGMVAYVMMWPLAVTSLNTVVDWMGKDRWRKLQRTVYGVATLTIVHVALQMESAFLVEPLVYLLIFATIMVYRSWSKRHYVPPKKKSSVRSGEKKTVSPTA